MANRKSLTQKVRFEVFKRDSFKCQYCGRSAPDVILNVDHIKPVKDGGDNEMTNLLTSCFDCNQGKKARRLSDDSEMKKQKKMLDDLNERRKQLEMMMKWREGLESIEDDKLDIFERKLEEEFGCGLTETGKKNAKKIIKKYPLNIVLDSIEASTSYLRTNKKGDFTSESRDKAFSMISRICSNKMKPESSNKDKDAFYVRGILRNRLSYCNEKIAIILIKKAQKSGVEQAELVEVAKSVNNWTGFRYAIEELISAAEKNGVDELA